MFLPPRWLLYHSMPASEPLFLLFVMLAVVAFEKRRLPVAGVLGGLAAITRIFGVLLPVGFVLAWLLARDRDERPRRRELAWLLLTPAFLVAHFALYAYRFDDFFAYFTQNGRELTAPFASVFAFAAGHTVGGGAHGDLFVYLLLFFCLAWTFRNGNRTLFAVAVVLAVPAVTTRLHDVARFLIPSLALVVFPALDPLLQKKEARVAALLSVPLVYLYAWRCVLENNLPPRIWGELSTYLRSM